MIQLNSGQILAKKQRLDEAKKILNKEFIGLSSVIDVIFDSLSSWYLFPEIQERPVIINLWGLTGVGKSSLVQRIAELIDFDKKYFRFDLGASSDRSWDVKNKLEDIYENENGYPVIIGLDEFQHAKTKNEKGEEMEKIQGRIIWDLLDSGKFNVSRSMNALDRIYTQRQKLKSVLHYGVKVENGKVIERHEKFIDFMGMKWKKFRNDTLEVNYEKEDLFFVDPDDYRDIYILAEELFESEFAVGDQLRNMNGEETIHFLNNIVDIGLSPKKVDCSKALIFVMGNLDEVYTMNGDFNPDISADEFYNRSLKINLSNVKSALKERFRSEQIARLGNIHIIYPAFSQNSFLQLIELELNKVKGRYEHSIGIKVEFDNSVIDVIYREGVFPTQGTRPLFTTINYLIGSRIGKIYTEIQLNSLEPDKVLIKCVEDYMLIEMIKEENVICIMREKLDLNLEKLRKSRKDDLQAITAVHEAGHAVLSVALMSRIPEYIYSVTADSETHGFTYIRNNAKYVSKRNIVTSTAIYMGGLAAEKLIFGDENITTGADDDLRRATRFVMDMLKSCGMGSKKAWINVEDPFNNLALFDLDNSLNKEGEDILKQAFEMAMQTLIKEKQFLLKLSDYLADNRLIKKEQLKKMIAESMINFPKTENENANVFHYRGHLKELVSGEKKLPETHLPIKAYGFALNKDKSEK